MKTKIIALAVIGLLIFSCKSKVAVGTTQPDTVQVPPKVASPNEKPISEELAVGRTMYEANCAKCHKLFAPTDYSKEAWGPILVRMQKKAHLEDAEMAKINNYIFSEL
jgi:cytochrome c5